MSRKLLPGVGAYPRLPMCIYHLLQILCECVNVYLLHQQLFLILCYKIDPKIQFFLYTVPESYKLKPGCKTLCHCVLIFSSDLKPNAIFQFVDHF